MTNNTLVAAKTWYESELVAKLSDALGVEKSKITATWTISGFKTIIDLTQGELVTKYTLTYEGGNLTMSGISYKQIFTEPEDEAARTLTGIQAKNVSIDLATLSALAQLINGVLEQEYTEPTETAEPADAPATPAEPAADTPVYPDEETWDGNGDAEYHEQLRH